MEYAYATCLLNESGAEINEVNLTAVLEAAGCPVQESRVKAIVAALEDVEVPSSVDFAAVGADGESEETDDPDPSAPEPAATAEDSEPTADPAEMDIIPADPQPVAGHEATQTEPVAGDETERPGTATSDDLAATDAGDPPESPDSAEPGAGGDGDGG